MAKPVKKGDTLRCEICGVTLVVTKDCGCEPCEIICCGKPMKIENEPKKTSCCKG